MVGKFEFQLDILFPLAAANNLVQSGARISALRQWNWRFRGACTAIEMRNGLTIGNAYTRQQRSDLCVES